MIAAEVPRAGTATYRHESRKWERPLMTKIQKMGIVSVGRKSFKPIYRTVVSECATGSRCSEGCKREPGRLQDTVRKIPGGEGGPAAVYARTGRIRRSGELRRSGHQIQDRRGNFGMTSICGGAIRKRFSTKMPSRRSPRVWITFTRLQFPCRPDGLARAVQARSTQGRPIGLIHGGSGGVGHFAISSRRPREHVF
jgi:hypothetical protein